MTETTESDLTQVPKSGLDMEAHAATNRRGYGEGSITKRKDKNGKVIGYQVQVLLPGGERKTLGTVRTKREAQKLAAQGQVDLAAGRLVSSPRQTVAEYLAAWLEVKQPSVRYKTYVTYRTAIGHATKHLGHLRLDALRPAHIEQCERELRQDKGARCVQQVHSVLHNALRRAVQLDLIARNPTEAVIPPRPTRSERPTLSLEQAHAFFEATRGEWLHALYVTLACTGLRLGEALGLCWEDVDLEGQMLRLRRSQQRETGKGFVLDDLKTPKSRRVVPLMAVTVEALRTQRTRQREQRLLLGSDWTNCGRVFCSEVGTPLDPANVRRHYYAQLAECGLPRVRLHDLRHTAVSVMAAEGIPLHLIQAVAGHAHASTTMDIYTHVLSSSLREVSDRMNAAYARVQDAAAGGS
jgi:integrase